MLPHRMLVGLSCLLVVTAGCIQADPDDAPDDAVVLPAGVDVLRAYEDVLIVDHPHDAPAQHRAFEYNAEHVAQMLLDDDGLGPVSVGELDIRDGYAFVATFNPQSGFVILDLEDPGEPRFVGRYDAGTAYAADVKATDDARWAFVATEPEAIFLGAGLPLADYLIDSLDPSGLKIAGDFGLQLVDLSDKSDPQLVWTHVSDPLGYHMVDWMEIDGEIYVFGAVLTDPRVDILRLETDPVPMLVPVGSYQHPAAQDRERNFLVADISEAIIVHDMTASMDPLEDFPLLTVSYWTLGAHMVDISDPSDPQLLGIWDDFVEVPWGNAHTAKVTQVEDRRILVVSPEYRGLEQQGVLWIVDATDFERPELLGTWSLPGHLPFEALYKFSTHNFELFDGKIYHAHFHAGAQVLDISTIEKARDPPVLAITLPEGIHPISAPTLPGAGNPLIWDAIPYEDHFYLTDITGGLHVYRLHPGAAPAPGAGPPHVLP
jgi:hypothetical protein